MNSIKGQYAIVGVGESDVGKRGSRPGVTVMDLDLEAGVRAIRDSGLRKEDIDGVIARGPQSNYSAVLAGCLGLPPRHYICDVGLSGSASATMILNAVAALHAGFCTSVLCMNGSVGGDEGGGGGEGVRGGWVHDLSQPFGQLGAPTGYSLLARRHMHEYGTTSEQFGAIAVACRKHASLNSNASYRTPITLEDHQNSRMIADPFRLLDCCPSTVAAGAVIITSAERARDLPNKPVYLLGLGHCNTHSDGQYAPNMTTVAMRDASQRAYEMAGLGPKDVDFANLYDCFTYAALVTLEDYGFCKKGEGGAFVENGRIELGGELPLNTGGGLLSQGHASGFLHITESATQLRGAAGERQVADAKIGIVSGQCGTLGINACLLLGNEPG
ncbi:MAG: thiolase [Chloroflexi bacterium]|nr:thiolase [Chloroflexota bacterium]